jgi:type II secretory pathway pseudopilin PulG
MWAVFLLFILGVYMVRLEYNAQRIRREAKEDAQRGALQNIEQTLRVMRSEQQGKLTRQIPDAGDH